MNIISKNIDIIEAHIQTPPGMMFYDSLKSIQSDVNILGYISVIERAWREMKLDGVLCLDNRPVLYLKKYGRPFSSHERINLQRLFWNQGVANVLVLVDPLTVFIYSGLAKPQNEDFDKEPDENALVDTLTQVEYVQQIQALYHALATGHYYELHQNYFEPNQTVDAWLLDNLRNLRNSLIENEDGLDIKTAHAFIGRILFMSYLLDRGIYSIGKLTTSRRTGTMLLAETLERKKSHNSRLNFLYGLFNELKDKFNGNMFDQDLKAEKLLIRSNHINKLILFLGGHDVGNGQRTLGFWPYNFKMIPVETISAIYQDFLGAEDQDRQRQRGAFYTPRFLAEMVVDVAFDGKPEAYKWSFLDPACGSGIFLVILFNRLARHWIYKTGRTHYVTRAKALQNILSNQIRGVDIEETACRIACFSLYLAYMDFFDPPDIQQHIEKIGRPLPKLLNYKERNNNPDADILVIHENDFFGPETLAGEKFDCIIGNPPWKDRGSKQIAQKFMQKAPNFLKNEGVGCLLLPSKIFQNQTDRFQSEWLQKVTLEKVIQLADYNRFLFYNANTPAFISRFLKRPPQINHDTVEFAAPKFNRDGLRQGIIVINPSTRIWISLIDIIKATKSKNVPAPVVWKRRLWGTQRDQKLLDLLQVMPSLNEVVDMLSELRKQQLKPNKRWIIGQGLKPWPINKMNSDRDPKPNEWPLEMPFIKAKSWNSDLLLMIDDTISFKERLEKKHYRTDVLYSDPPPELFSPPMVLISHGFSKVTYCDFAVLFQHSFESITGPQEDKELLLFLTAYLRSNLSKYYLFHTVSNWGSERAKVHLNELLRLPFPIPGNEFISADADKIIKQVASKIKKLHGELQNTYNQLEEEAKRYTLLKDEKPDVSKEWYRERKIKTNSLQNELEPLIYQYFGLTQQEITLIEDTVRIFIPSATPTTWRSPKTFTLDPINETTVEPYASMGLAVYADTLTDTLNSWAETEDSGYFVNAEGGLDNRTGMTMVTLILSHKKTNYRQKSLSEELSEVLKSYQSQASKKNGTLHYERDIFFFQGKKIHIIRPNILLNWTRTAAINDAAKIYGEVALIH